MIEEFCGQIINELGASGILVLGLYFLLYRPLTTMASTLRTINHELQEIIRLLARYTSNVEEQKKR